MCAYMVNFDADSVKTIIMETFPLLHHYFFIIIETSIKIKILFPLAFHQIDFDWVIFKKNVINWKLGLNPTFVKKKRKSQKSCTFLI